MALDTVQDILATWPGWTSISPDYGDEWAGIASGGLEVWELRDVLWRLTAETRELRPSVLRYWQARVESLENGKALFWGYGLSSKYPILYPEGTWPTGVAFDGLSAAVHTIGAANKSLRLKSLPVGYVVSVGDMLQLTHSDATVTLVRAMETATADGSGNTPEFEIRPHVESPAAVDDVVAVKRPACKMIIIPGTLDVREDRSSGMGTIRFEALEYIA